jgi:hypothetical protein
MGICEQGDLLRGGGFHCVSTVDQLVPESSLVKGR